MDKPVTGYMKSMFAALIICFSVNPSLAQTTAFSYQGRLNDNGNPANGQFDFQFKLFDAVSGGTQQGTTQTLTGITVTNGSFAVTLDFGACPTCFDGASRFLEIAVKPGGGGSFTTLSPRQPVTSTPYALKSQNAGTADGLSVACVSCITSSQIQSVSGSAVSGTIPVASVPAGSASYIQNGTSPQAASNFNISGNGTANILDAQTQFNLGGNRILSKAGTSNLFVGVGAGQSNTTGSFNSFFGPSTGSANTTGQFNAFFGQGAGEANTTGNNNAFFGTSAGFSNTTAGNNAFFGNSAGVFNTTGFFNSFFGAGAGNANTTGSNNAFFGTLAGQANTTAGNNAFFGNSAGVFNTTGTSNAFFGASAGDANTTGSNLTLLGANANVGANNLTFATALGASAIVNSSNTVVLGRAADTVQIPGSLSITGSTTFGGTLAANSFDAATQYKIGGSRILSNAGTFNLFAGVNAGPNTTGSNNAFFGSGSGASNTTGGFNTFSGTGSGATNTTGNFNAFFGFNAGVDNTTGINNTFIGVNAGNPNAATQVNNSVAIGSGVKVSTSNTIVLGTSTQTTQIPGQLAVSGGGVNTFSLGFSGLLVDNLIIRRLAAGDILPSPAHVCFRSAAAGSDGGWGLTTCTSAAAPSSYKTELQPFSGGLEVINRLQPMQFAWKDGSGRDIGLSADAVAEVEPLVVTRNAKGEVEDVKEGSLTVLFINAFKEQQAQIKLLQQQLEALKKLVCADHPEAAACK